MATRPQKKAVNVRKGTTSKKETGAMTPFSPLWDEPWLSLRDEMDKVFDRFIGAPMGRGLLSKRFADLEPFRAAFGGTAPSVDVKETDKAYEVTAELPGMSEKDIELSLSDGLLTLKGEKRSEKEEKEENYHLTERRYGSFSRSFRLPGTVDEGKVIAEFEKGVLTVTLPKTAAAQKKSRKIDVKSK